MGIRQATRAGTALIASLALSMPVSGAVVVDTDALLRRTPEATGLSLTGFGRRPSMTPGFAANVSQVQTFTASVAGQLHGIDLQIFQDNRFGAGTLSLTLVEGDFAAGARAIRGSADVPTAALRTTASGRDLEPLLRFDTSAFQLGLAAGDRFSVIFTIIPDGDFAAASLLVGNTTGAVEELPGIGFRPIVQRSNYAGGALYTLFPDGRLGAPGISDVGFRTFIAASAGAIPEPGSWALMILGHGVIGGLYRRRKSPHAAPRTSPQSAR